MAAITNQSILVYTIHMHQFGLVGEVTGWQ